MQIVIDIPNFTFTDLKKKQNRTEVDVAVLNGTPLPKGHGRLIDADELLKRIAEKCKTPSLSEDTVNGLCGATAIIYDMLIESGQEK